MLTQKATIFIHGENERLNVELAQEIYDRLDRLGFSMSMKTPKGGSFTAKTTDRESIRIITVDDN